MTKRIMWLALLAVLLCSGAHDATAGTSNEYYLEPGEIMYISKSGIREFGCIGIAAGSSIRVWAYRLTQ
jgi:hypothetical protein